MKLLFQQAPALPLTAVNLIIPRRGACVDPPEQSGLSRLMLRLMFMGAGGLSNLAYNSRLERLGATAGAGLNNDTYILRLTTLTDNLDAALALFVLGIQEPNFDAGEFERLKSELRSAWVADREESKRLRAQEVYLRRVYGGKPHGYQPDGTEAGLLACTLEDIQRQYRALFQGTEPLLAVLSNLPEKEAERRVTPLLGLPWASNHQPYPWDEFTPPVQRGRSVTIVKERGTNTDEVVLGAFSVPENDPDWHLHRLIALIFGGDMNSRLFRVVRGERGLSYGASCWYESSQGRVPRDRSAPFSMYTFPSAEHTAEAVPLMISLYEDLVDKGVTDEELRRTRASLINAHPFLWDTPQKILALRVEQALYGVMIDDEETNRRKLTDVTPGDVLTALRQSHHPNHLQVVMLGDPERLEPITASIPGVEQVETLEYP